MRGDTPPNYEGEAAYQETYDREYASIAEEAKYYAKKYLAGTDKDMAGDSMFDDVLLNGDLGCGDAGTKVFAMVLAGMPVEEIQKVLLHEICDYEAEKRAGGGWE
jgi:hypothetical protein